MFSTQRVLRKIRDGGDHELFFFSDMLSWNSYAISK